MSFEVADVTTEVDLSKLISFSMSFQPLQLLFQSILQRTKNVESENERQDDEISELRDALKNLQQRDAEREAQLQELLQQQEELRKQMDLEKQATEDVNKEADVPPVDTSQLWEEINQIKRHIGEFHHPGRRHTIEELYHARRRKDSFTGVMDVKPRRPLASITQIGDVSEVTGTPVGDVILGRAREQLKVGDEEQARMSLPDEGGSTGESVEPPLRGRKEEKYVFPMPEEGMRSQEREEGKHPDSSKEKRLGGDLEAPSFLGDGEDRSIPFRKGSPFPAERSGLLSPGALKGVSPTSSSPAHSGEPSSRSGNLSSIYDRLKKDGKDIEHLNRVVAEMLNEMKDLHADVDFMRTFNMGEEGVEKPDVTDPNATKERADLRRRVKALEDDVSRLQGIVSSLDVHDTKPAFEAPRSLSIMDGMKGLKERMDALEKAQERMGNKMDGLMNAAMSSGAETGATPSQLGVLGSAVNTIEKQLADLQRLGLRNYDTDLEELRRVVDKLIRDTEALEKTCLLLDEKKEDKGDRRPSTVAPKSEGADAAPMQAPPSVKDTSDSSAAVLDDLQRCLQDMQRRMLHTETNVMDLNEQKADRAAFQRLADELKNLRQLLELGAGRRGDEDAAQSASAAQGELMQALQEQMAEHMQNFNMVRDGTTNELDALREYIEQIDHRKADAKLVANKAERDYVENALERLMREVEQVLNATNAGLIDTLDKSLNVLRDMLEGKATKHDMDNLRRLVSEDHIAGGAPDALAGFRGFRCLGCNRPVETMRPRVMGNRLQPFVNRLPQNHPGDPIAARIQQGPSAASDGMHTVSDGG
ncbi:hypothetical protein TcG_04517 [Trypanosoma cruzi]|nr:hypothetical protein BCY84_07801 [Trypanosoma cruzi cruzi]RNF19675.1 hypothetical protein TcG_04517 [Trypanosoma cruzi]